MADNPTPKSAPHSETIIIDRSYIREQANVALKAFVAPLSGVFAATFGPIATPAETPKPQKENKGN